MEQLTLEGGSVPPDQIPEPKKEGRSVRTPKMNRAIAHMCSKGYRLQMSTHPNYRFETQDGQVDIIPIDQLLAEYDADKKEERRIRAAERRMAKGRHNG